GYDWNQALMDLGAQVCTARSPQCDVCPIADRCRWRGNGGTDPAARSAARPRPQGRFEDSDRFHRGRLVDAMRDGPVGRGDVPTAARLSEDTPRCDRIVAALVRDGLAVWDGD